MIRLTREQVRQVDRLAIEEYHIPGIVLMENASRGVADAAQEMLRTTGGRRILILCGGGNNGGDGLAAGRHLHNRGFDVLLGLCTDLAGYKSDALVNWQIVQAMKLPCGAATPESIHAVQVDLIIDAVFGTGLTQTPRSPFDQIVSAVAETQSAVLAVDLPSGMDCDSGEPLGACMRSLHTVTFVAEKAGFANPQSKHFTGHVTVADIGCPRELIERVRSDT